MKTTGLSLFQMNALLGEFQRRYQNISVTAVRILLEIAQYDDTEGDDSELPSIQDLVDALEIPQPTVSRLLRMLGDGDEKLKPEGGLGLVRTFRDPEYHKVKRSALTDAGATLIYGLFFHPKLQSKPKRKRPR